MAEDFVQVAPDSTGKKIRNLKFTIGASDVEQQVVSMALADGTLVAGGAAAIPTQDDYIGGECLTDQNGAGGVLSFVFASAVNHVVVHSQGAALIARCDPFGGTPSATTGFICEADIPVYLPVTVTTVKVFAPVGTVVSVAGFRRA